MISLNVNQKTLPGRCRSRYAVIMGDKRCHRSYRNKIWLWGGTMRRLRCHLNGEAVRSCVTKVRRAEGQKLVTIEGLSENNDHPLQLAWQEIDVPQCGYCHSGQLMSAAVLLRENPNPTDQDIDDAMAGNICRCGTYLRIRKAIHLAAEMQQKGKSMT